MSRWSEQFSSSPIHGTLDQLYEWSNPDISDVDAEHEIEKRRLRKSLDVIREVLADVDPEYYPEEFLQNLHRRLSEPPVSNSFATYSTSPTVQNLREANDGLTALASMVGQLAALSQPRASRETLTSLENSLDDYKKKVSAALNAFESSNASNAVSIGQLSAETDTLKNNLTALRQNIESTLSSWQATYTDAQTKRAEEFSAAQIERGTKFDESLRDLSAKYEVDNKSMSVSQVKKLQENHDAYQLQVEGMILDMKAKHASILSIHGLVGTDGVAGGYQSTANYEQGAANTWRLISVGALGLAAVWILIKYCLGFELTVEGQVNWAEVVTAASLTLILVGASGYAARQSKLHRETERQMKWFSLEVNAIDPFLTSLPKEQQELLKTQLAQKLFGQSRRSTEKGEAQVDATTLKSVVDSIVGLVSSIRSS